MGKRNKNIKYVDNWEKNNKENHKSLKYSLFSSLLIALGPILWLFINIEEKRYEYLPLNIVATIIALAGFLFCLRLYLKDISGRNSLKRIIKLVVDYFMDKI